LWRAAENGVVSEGMSGKILFLAKGAVRWTNAEPARKKAGCPPGFGLESTGVTADSLALDVTWRGDACDLSCPADVFLCRH